MDREGRDVIYLPFFSMISKMPSAFDLRTFYQRQPFQHRVEITFRVISALDTSCYVPPWTSQRSVTCCHSCLW